MTEQVIKLSKILWDYHTLKQKVKKSDIILGLGSIDIKTADRSAELYLQGYAPKIIFSGGVAHTNDILRTTWKLSEAAVFANRAIELGVPKEDIYIESGATNTGENITLSYEIIKRENLEVKKMILVQKPYMERRTYATFMKQWPGDKIEIFVTSLNMPFEEYLDTTEAEQDKIINIMVGDLQRIKIYPEKGFQIPQEIPDNVWNAYEELVRLGYDKHVIKN